MAALLTDRELGKRIGASRGYAGDGRAKFGRRLSVTRQTITRWEGGKIPQRQRERENLIRDCMRLSGLPREFFEVDFADLPAMVSEHAAAARRRLQAIGPAGAQQPEPGRQPSPETDRDLPEAAEE